MAISRDELYKMIQEWRDNGSSEAYDARKPLQIGFYDYLDSIMNSKKYDTFAVDDDGNATDDYTPEYEATEAEVMNDLGLDEDDMRLIFKAANDSEIADADNPVTSKTIVDKDDDGDVDITITKQDDGNDKKPESDEPHDEGLAGETTPEEEEMLKLATGESEPSTELAGDTTLEEDLMLNPDMSPSEFSKKAAEKRSAKAGEPAPDMNFTNSIANTLKNYRW